MSFNLVYFVAVQLAILSFSLVLSFKLQLASTPKPYIPSLSLESGKETIDVDIHKIYVFNITNPSEVEAGKDPIFKEVGPWVYRLLRKKFDIEKLDDDTITYKQQRVWHFMPELSEGRQETDELNIINSPMLVMAKAMNYFKLPKAFNDILVEELTDEFGENLVRRDEKFEDIMWKGMNITPYFNIYVDLAQGAKVPEEFDDGLFAVFKNKNGSVQAEYKILSTGGYVGEIVEVNNKTQLDYWSGDYCNQLQGTDGYFFRPIQNEAQKIQIFSYELCRDLVLRPNGRERYKDFAVNVFSYDQNSLDNGASNPDNLCYCDLPPNTTDHQCLKPGLIDLSGCTKHSPIIGSWPHFLDADESLYLHDTKGLDPVAAKHRTMFRIEPTTGTILSAFRTYQLNIGLKAYDNVGLFQNSTEKIYPFAWFSSELEVPEEKTDWLRSELNSLNIVVADKKDEYETDNTTEKPKKKKGKKRKNGASSLNPVNIFTTILFVIISKFLVFN